MTTLTEDDALSAIAAAMVEDLWGAGAKPMLPERQPGQYTGRELAKLSGCCFDSRDFREKLDDLVKSGKWRKQQAVIREDGRVYHSTVYERVV